MKESNVKSTETNEILAPIPRPLCEPSTQGNQKAKGNIVQFKAKTRLSNAGGGADLHDQGSTTKLYNLKVDKAKRGQGMGKELVQDAISTAQAQGKNKLALDSQDNGSGRLDSWYKRQGFKAVGKTGKHTSFEMDLKGSTIQRKKGEVANPEVRSALLAEGPATNNTGLPNGLKTKIEATFGTSLDHIRVNKNSSFPSKVGAIATTQGNRIDFAPGHYNPHTAQGQKLIGHEAWHTVQQAQGRVKPTLQMKTGHMVNDSSQLEAEADRMGERVVQEGRRHQLPASRIVPRLASQYPIQRAINFLGNFDAANEPELEFDGSNLREMERWEDAQYGKKLYLEGDAEIDQEDKNLNSFMALVDGQPNLDLNITTSSGMAISGQTTFSVHDGTRFRSISATGPHPATTDEWPPWVASGNRVRMEVSINERLTQAQMAHTLNHELSLHASSDLKLIMKLREMGNATMATNYVKATLFKRGVHSGDYHHQLLAQDKHPRLKATHKAMVAKLQGRGVSAASLQEDYAADVKDHRHYIPTAYVPPGKR